MFKLPFGFLPGHWGLRGKTREAAKAEYELSGFELEEKLHNLAKDQMDPESWDKMHWAILRKHEKITQREYSERYVGLIKDEKQRKIAMLELDKSDGLISDLEYQKNVATINEEPWVTVINMDFSNGKSTEGSFELDWNDFFIEKLRKDGYSGPTDDVIVNTWFMELCKNIALEEFDGTGNFTADSEANLEAFKRWNSTETLNDGKKGYK